ncbi:hypothetical protein BGX29_009508 [Mortierella sp. GBA35]|nr:hypothetical protein BGX29_009508 [Mortierella sp. GBA35]
MKTSIALLLTLTTVTSLIAQAAPVDKRGDNGWPAPPVDKPHEPTWDRRKEPTWDSAPGTVELHEPSWEKRENIHNTDTEWSSPNMPDNDWP